MQNIGPEHRAEGSQAAVNELRAVPVKGGEAPGWKIILDASRDYRCH